MIYKDFKGEKISQLAFGAMRLPCRSADQSDIDMEKTQELVDLCMANGVNYYDTAWGYHNGRSEVAIGKALSGYPRADFKLADKFPGYDPSNMGKHEEIFAEQLKRCGVDYFDFYLLHNVCELNIEQYLDPDIGTVPYFIEMRRQGKIRHLGFSCHSNYANMERFLEAFGEDMEFCQIQLNYIDYSMQGAKRKVDLLNAAGIPIWVMEPLRGGKILTLSKPFEEDLRKVKPDYDIAEWAFRYLQSVPGVTTVLSGISDMAQTEDKLRIFSEEKPLTGKETEFLMDCVSKMLSAELVPCTSCRYCTSYCAKGLDIPTILDLYNEHTLSKGGFRAPMGLAAMPEGKRPQDCVGCGKCSDVCPQKIKIPELMKDFVRMLSEYPPF